MPKRFLSEQAKHALGSAIQTVEAKSAAEVVITVRRRSSCYTGVHVVFAAVCSFAMLAFLLFSPYSFSLWSVLLDPWLVAIGAYATSSQVPAMSRWMTPARVLAERVQSAAHRMFFDKGVRHTRDRIGILVFLSLTERRAVIIADSGVQDAVPLGPWNQAVAEISAAMQEGRSGTEIAKRIANLGDILSQVLPRGEDDENELPDEVCGQ